MSATVPRYADLPVLIEEGDYRHAWDHFTTDDNLGCLGRIHDAERLSALETVTSGQTVNLSLPLTLPDPPMFGRKALEHTMWAPHRNGMDDRLDNFYPQASTQWDGFRHVRAREFGFFTGHQGNFDPTDGQLGIQHFAESGIIGRGVLVDLSAPYLAAVQAGRGDEEFVIYPTDLRSALEVTNTTTRPGDILCVRTGWMNRYLQADPVVRAHMATSRIWPGLAGSSAMAEFLWDFQFAAVTADNPAVELGPGRADLGSLHRRAIPLLGLPFGELFTFEALAPALQQLGRSTFAFVSVPLNLPGGVGSPGNAIALL